MGLQYVYSDCATCERRNIAEVIYTCDKCGEQKSVSRLGAYAENYLILRLDGGYGMFCDSLGSLMRSTQTESDVLNPELVKAYCHRCAHEVCQTLGIDTSGWHSHANADEDSHPLTASSVSARE